MPERSAVAERYRPARLTKMPRNRVHKKDLDVRIGSANLPLSNLPKVQAWSAKKSLAGEERQEMTIPHRTSLRSVSFVVATERHRGCEVRCSKAVPVQDLF